MQRGHMRDSHLTLCALSLAILACGDGGRVHALPDAPIFTDAAVDSTSDFTLTVVKEGGGTGTVTSREAGVDCGDDCSEAYPSGTTVTLTATPGPGTTFVGWAGGNCTGTGACTVMLSEDTDVTASFELDNTIVVTRAGSGTGTVTSSPAGISCGATCAAGFSPNQAVTLTAVAVAGSTFTGWAGGGCTGTGPCTTTITAAT